MNPCKTEQEYIDQIYLAAQKACAKYGYLPSVLIAQACLENGYGIPSYWDNPQISLLIKYWNMVGIKSELLNKSWTDIGLSVWDGQSLTKQTPEIYGGKKVIITDNFRKYHSAEESFVDYLLFLTYASNYGAGGAPKYGPEVLNIKDPAKLISEVNRRGYTTGTTYPSSVMKIINKHNLTKYDALAGVKPTELLPPALQKGGNVKTKKLKAPKFIDNRAASKSQVPKWVNKADKKWIVVHYLGVVGQNFELWDNGYGATFTIGWNGDVYYTADYTAVTWQCGGKIQGEAKDGSGIAPHRYYGQCTNYNSVSIENCVKRTDGKYEGDDNDDKWYFTEETQESLVWAVSKMMDDLNIPIERVIRHFDVTGKICPNPYVRNNGKNGNWTWEQFLANLKQYRKDGTISLYNGATPTPEPEKKWYRVRKSAKDEKSQIGAYEVLQNAKDAANANRGYKVFDWDFKCVYDPFRWKFLDSCQNVVDKARTEGWRYGDSRATPPCSDKLISCDRLIARAMYDLGYKDQRTGGETCGTLDSWLSAHGWKKVTDPAKILPGAVVGVHYKKNNYIDHVFVIVSYNHKAGTCTKYDTGCNERIQSKQPVTVKFLEWGPDRVFWAAWNPPETSTLEPDQKEDKSGIKYPTTYNGIDYSAVYAYSYYKKKYPDLQKAFGTKKNDYFKHFVEFGMKEGRQAKLTFNVQKYKARYADLQKAFGGNLPLYYKHYCQFGKKEGRKAT